MERDCETCRHYLGGGLCRINLEAECGAGCYEAWEAAADESPKCAEEMTPFCATLIVRCKDCRNCYKLANSDPMEPYDGSGDGSFYCTAFDMDFYAPQYHAASFYCADGAPRH